MSIYIPFLIFAFVASITPEPNNVMVFAIAAAHGTRAAVPAVVGVAIGFGLMVAIVGEGLAMPMARFPWLYGAMRWIGVAWTLVVAWTIARADTTAAAGQRSGSPPGFFAAAGFQWINPKASAHISTVAFRNVYDLIQGNDIAAALAVWRDLVELPKLLFTEPSPGPIKHYLWRQGLIDSPETRAPMTGISAALAERIDAMTGVLPRTPSRGAAS